jgi:uncharacterized repeat protein (TIGR03837 family)
MPALRWSLYCRVIDNLGDAGFCWRLARDLAARGDRVQLIIDDATPLAWMGPGGAPGVTIHGWPGPAAAADVVVEAYGCDLPPVAVAAMAAAARDGAAPVWINLEYLSAEGYVERSHGLPSPQRCGLTKWFYFPGYTRRTGGLLREPGLLRERAGFDRAAWLAGLGLTVAPGERVVSLFCYDSAALPALLDELARAPTLLLLTAGAAQRQVGAAPAGVRLARLSWLSQPDFDRLLWAGDLNFVRGEDSLVRAIWAGAPFVWQAYPQHDGAHFAKLEALLQAMAAAPAVARLWRAWNAAPGLPWSGLPEAGPWRLAAADWRARLCEQTDLGSQLRAYALGKARPHC